MPDIRVARRYTSALFELAKQNNLIETVEKDLKLLADSLKRGTDLRAVLDHPLIPATRKKTLFHTATGDQIHSITLQFVDLLIDKHRTPVFESIPREYQALSDQYHDMIEAQVTTAVPLPQDQETKLIQRLVDFTGKKIRLVCKIDSSLIGGMKIQIGDTVMDGSVSSQLRILKEKLQAG